MTEFLLDDLRIVGSRVDGGVPDGDPATAWDRRKTSYRLVSPLNRRKFTVIVVGCGLAGAGCAAALGELGYDVECFTYHDSPRRAHSIAAQGGINSPRAKKVDNDSILRFVKDTVEGGDFRSREADCFRLGEESLRVIDHMNAIGAPFAREYGGQLATRSFGGVQVSRTYYTRGQTGQQLEIAATQALWRQIAKGSVRLHTRHEMLDLIVKDGVTRGIVARDMVTGQIQPYTAHAVVLATGGYANVFGKSTNAMNSNATAAFRAHRRGAYFASPCFIQFHPTTLPISSPWQSKRMLMSESLRNDARIWVPKTKGDDRPPNDIPEDERDYFLERRYPAFGNLVPRDVASRANALEIKDGHGVGPLHNGVYLDLRDAIAPGSRRDQRAVRQLAGDVSRKHRRGPPTGADAYRTWRAFLHGWAVDRLRLDVQRGRAVRRRRGQLGLPWGQPAGRQFAAVSMRRRLVHPSGHRAELPRITIGHRAAHRRRSGGDRHRESRAGRRGAPARQRRHPSRRLLPPPARRPALRRMRGEPAG